MKTSFVQKEMNDCLIVALVLFAYRAEAHILNVLSGVTSFVSYSIVVDDCRPDNPGSTRERLC
jgi:hypothetical protein